MTFHYYFCLRYSLSSKQHNIWFLRANDARRHFHDNPVLKLEAKDPKIMHFKVPSPNDLGSCKPEVIGLYTLRMLGGPTQQCSSLVMIEELETEN